MAYKEEGGGGQIQLEEMQKLLNSFMDCFINLKPWTLKAVTV